MSPTIQLGASTSAPPLVSRFSQIFEPSGVINFPNGDILIIEDEGDSPLHLTNFSDNSSSDKISLNQPTSIRLASPVDDLEGITLGRDGMIFLITSFSTTKKGKRKQKRQRLIQLKIENGRIVHELHFDNLLPHLTEQLANEKYLDKPGVDALNIEGIAFDKDKKHLLLGLRAPMKESEAIILVLENPYEIFSKTVPPRFSNPNIALDMAGGGIRAITYDDTLKTYLLANEIRNRKDKLRPGLWAWDGNPAHEPSRISLPKMKGVSNIEGITSVVINTKSYLLLMCDDGQRKTGKGAHYILLDHALLTKQATPK